MTDERIETFFESYICAALWAEMDNADEQGGESLDANYDISDFDQDFLTKQREECVDFLTAHPEDGKAVAYLSDLDEMGLEQAGHDFWLTRNRHGAGFWDRGLGVIGDILTNRAHSYGSVDLYVGDDGKIYGG